MYAALLKDWGALAKLYPGWTLSEIKELSRRERENWAGVYQSMRR